MKVKSHLPARLARAFNKNLFKVFLSVVALAAAGLGISIIVRATGGSVSAEIVKRHLGETLNGVQVDTRFVYLWYGNQYYAGNPDIGTGDGSGSGEKLWHTYYYYANQDGSQYDAVCLQPYIQYTSIDDTQNTTATAYDSTDGDVYEKLKLVLMATTVPAFSNKTYGSYSWSSLVSLIAPAATSDFYYHSGGTYKHSSVYGLDSYLIGHVLGGRLFTSNSYNDGYWYVPTGAVSALESTLNAILSDATLLAQAQNYTLYITPNSSTEIGASGNQSLGFVKQTSSTPTYEHSYFEVCKVDSSQNPILDAGTASFTVSGTYNGSPVSYPLATTVSGNRNCTSQVEFDTNTSISIVETSAPTGYTLDTTTRYNTSSSTAGNLISMPIINTKSITPTVERGDLEFTKNRSIINATNPSGMPMSAGWSGKQFTLSNGTQTVTLTADLSGKVSTCDDTSVWFGGGSRPSGSGCQGALPVGNYTLTEIPSGEGIYNDSQSWNITITANGVATIGSGSVTNSFSDSPVITTSLIDFYDSTRTVDTIPAAPGQSVLDKVCYSGLDASASYHFYGFLYETTSSARPSADPSQQINSGITNSIARGTSAFNGSSSGCVNVQLSSFDATSYAGKQLSVIQYLYRDSSEFNESGFGILEAIHNYNLDTQSETVSVVSATVDPSISSTTANAVTGYGNVPAKKLFVGPTKIDDTVVVADTTLGTTYYLEAELVDANGNHVTLTNATSGAKTSGARRESCPGTGSTATCTVTLEFNSTAYQGQSLTVYESLYVGDAATPVSTHRVLGEASQTIEVFEAAITTTATNPADGTHIVGVGSVTVDDEVKYWDLVPGTTYRVSGELRTLSGTVVATSAHDFTPPTAVDSETVQFTFDSTEYHGQTLVVYETITLSGTEVVSHKSDNDTNQQITVGEATITATTATFAGNAKSVDSSAGSVAVSDSISYSGLAPGSNYTVISKLYKLNGSTADTSTPLLSEVVDPLTPTASTGTLTVNLGSLDVSTHAGEQFVVYDYLYSGSTLIASHEQNIADQTISVNALVPAINSTTASASSDHLISGQLRLGHVTISDQINYSGLDPTESYVLKGYLYHLAGSSAAALIDGSEVTKTFTPSANSGSESMSFNLDTTGYIGETIFVYEYLYAADGTTLLDSHADTSHTDQSIPVTTPTLTTAATNSANGASRTIPVAVAAGVNDAIVATGFVANDSHAYALTGTLYALADTSTPLVAATTLTNQHPDANGQIIASMDFTLDTSALQGAELVVWQDLTLDSTVIASEHDTAATSQQVVTVGTLNTTVDTTAYYGDAGPTRKVVPVESGITIHDSVTIEGLVLGATDYTLITELVTADGTRVPLANATSGTTEIYTGLGTITADQVSRTIDLTFDASNLAGQTLAVFQTLKRGTATVATHADLADADQAIKVKPRIGTAAIDAYDGDQTVGAGDATITDTVRYEGLDMGKSYTAYGYLVDKATGEYPKDADDIVYAYATGATFTIGDADTPESTGSIELSFTNIDVTKLAGKSLVVYEEIFEGNGVDADHLVAEHKDLADANQTIAVAHPKIRTTATDLADGDHTLAPSATVTIVDKVTYSGLVPGTTYTLTGVLMDKATGQPLSLNGSTRTLDFTPEHDAGDTEMRFTIDTANLAGKELVVFETLARTYPSDDDDTEPEIYTLVTHEDLTDKNQTVSVSVIIPNTGSVTSDHGTAAVSRTFLAALAGLLVTCGLLLKHFPYSQKHK